MIEKKRLHLLFEWGGGTLWSANDTARACLRPGPVEEQLPIDPTILEQLNALSQWHDSALDWADPLAPSPWTAQEQAHFDQAALALVQLLEVELGSDYEVIYQRL
ncbi:hypothetical protein [Pseudomonas sp. PH1b]|uniref:hypothetical protein n=1 Tax=Pseudomonas sp. PH1b TaxID=1397282 RepID=UPI0004685437|nr:hypothetical protein [Pseudomonas sp. PH1b]